MALSWSRESSLSLCGFAEIADRPIKQHMTVACDQEAGHHQKIPDHCLKYAILSVVFDSM
jgi:hypothetical protein